MDPVTAVVVSAIAAGAVAGVGDTAAQAIKDTYTELENLISRKYSDVDVSGLERKPGSDSKRASLGEDLEDAGVAGDTELGSAAAALLEAVRQHAPRTVVGVDVSGLVAAAMMISDVASTGDGVVVADSTISGDAKISGVHAGFTGPPDPLRGPGLNPGSTAPPAPGGNTFSGNTFGGDFFLNHSPSSTALRPLRELVTLFGAGDLPAVGEVNPYVLGVTASVAGNAHEHGRSDRYVARTRDRVDSRLEVALAGTRLVLVVGPSKVGKTRTLFEAVRTHNRLARILVPASDSIRELVAHPRIVGTRDPIVVWLDDLHEYLNVADPLTPALLARLTHRPGRTAIVATLRSDKREQMRQEADFQRDTRLLLEQDHRPGIHG